MIRIIKRKSTRYNNLYYLRVFENQLGALTNKAKKSGVSVREIIDDIIDELLMGKTNSLVRSLFKKEKDFVSKEEKFMIDSKNSFFLCV